MLVNILNGQSIGGFINNVEIVDKIHPTSTAYWFLGLPKITCIENIENIDTSNVTNMQGMFYGCNAIEELDLTSFDTSNVTDMSYMFGSFLANLETNTEKVWDNYLKDYMYFDSQLQEITFGENFDTSNVTNMRAMFLNCINLTALDLSNFNTSKVTDMSYMFKVGRRKVSYRDNIWRKF